MTLTEHLVFGARVPTQLEDSLKSLKFVPEIEIPDIRSGSCPELFTVTL